MIETSHSTILPLLTGYRPTSERRDEAADPEGQMRPHWQALAKQLSTLGAGEIERRWQQTRHDLRDQETPGDDTASAVPHTLLDPIPLLIEADEFTRLSAGLAQRARVLDAILADAYGDQRMLREGVIAPAALLANPAFLRPCHGQSRIGGHWLSAYAADLVHASDGRWLVRSDRIQVPGGDGWALANRLAVSRILPDSFRELRVRRHASYFHALRRHLASVAPRGRDNPRIVILTPGPYSPSHAEHSYLSRYLGYTLVEGGDLAISDDTVYLKTLGGLHQVDVILRRQDDDFCDPLEFRNDSTLGVPGLVESVRAGHVAIVNPFGAAVAESPALIAALPALCRLFLGEELLLPSIESWWAGDSLEVIESRIDEVALIPVFNPGRATRYLPREMGKAARAELIVQMRSRPHAWAAQLLVETTSVPAWQPDGVTPKPFSLRAYAVAEGDSYNVLPGGLCSIGATGQDRTPPTAEKDVWVLSEGPVDEATLLPPSNRPLELKRGSIELPSRVADNLYWIGRYAERAEATARLARVIAMRINEDADASTTAEVAVLRNMVRSAGMGDSDAVTGKSFLASVLGGEDGESGIRGCLKRLRHVGLAVRDRLSTDTARVIAQLEHARLRLDPHMITLSDGDRALDAIITGLAALAGMSTENTTRGPGWRFLDSGRRIERALITTELLRSSIAEEGSASPAALAVLLEVADSTITYRSRYLASLQPHAVLDLLLTDDSNPRSVLFQLEAIVAHLAALPHDSAHVLTTRPERLALGAWTWLRLVDPLELCKVDENEARPSLAHMLDHLSSDMALLSDSIASHYLSHGVTTRSLSNWSA